MVNASSCIILLSDNLRGGRDRESTCSKLYSGEESRFLPLMKVNNNCASKCRKPYLKIPASEMLALLPFEHEVGNGTAVLWSRRRLLTFNTGLFSDAVSF